MREQWYSDKRDLVKWSVLLILSKKHKIDRIVQIACQNPSKYGHIEIDGDAFSIPEQVIFHFRNIGHISKLATNPNISVFNKPYSSPPREQYFEEAKAFITSFSKEHCIVFLDPDTGLEPVNRPDQKHILDSELRAIWSVLPKDWILVLYQHKTTKSNQPWINQKHEQFAKALDVPASSVKIAQGTSVANDVVFFYITK